MNVHSFISDKITEFTDRSITNLLPLAGVTPRLRESILTFDPYKLACYGEQFYPVYLNIVRKMVRTFLIGRRFSLLYVINLSILPGNA